MRLDTASAMQREETIDMDANQLDVNSLAAIKSAIDLYLVQYHVTGKLWASFGIVTLLVLAFSVASDKVSRSFLEAGIVALGYVVFCVANFHALILAHSQLVQFSILARRVAGEHSVQLPGLERSPLAEEACFYWAVVIGVCAAILLITYRRRLYERQNSAWA
jgi:hypothetical protein